MENIKNTEKKIITINLEEGKTLSETGKVYVEPEQGKASLKDFGRAFKLSLGGSSISWSLRQATNSGYWFLPTLQKKLLWLSSHYVKLIVYLLGFLICVSTFKMGLDPTKVFLLIVAFSIVDVFLISPLIYLAVLPKPISAFMKKVDELTPEEMEAYKMQMNSDPVLEKKMQSFRYRPASKYEESKLRDFFKKDKE